MRGDMGGALDVLAGAGALTADFVSMAACGGRCVWEAAVRALAAQLETQGVLSFPPQQGPHAVHPPAYCMDDDAFADAIALCGLAAGLLHTCK